MTTLNNVKRSRLVALLRKCIVNHCRNEALAELCVEEMHRSYKEDPEKYDKNLRRFVVHQLKIITVRDISALEIDAVVSVDEYIREYLRSENENDLIKAVKVLMRAEKVSEKITLSSIKRNDSKEGFVRDFRKIFYGEINRNNFERYRKLLRSYGLGISKTSYVWKFINDCIIVNFNDAVHLRRRLSDSTRLKKQVKPWGILSALDSLIYAIYYPEMF